MLMKGESKGRENRDGKILNCINVNRFKKSCANSYWRKNHMICAALRMRRKKNGNLFGNAMICGRQFFQIEFCFFFHIERKKNSESMDNEHESVCTSQLTINSLTMHAIPFKNAISY